ncbi:hypothetical protein QFC21_006483 [Naganishia friedmannii]|uniref:Uncharacterized protein n=1 Tax=Naganishia friedmannii TaxID=89922 RepID=A0ACC2V3G6_9TREE|nr:hypothetical protein QFC21_006483 [Naganishia friedmannii]
MVNETKPNEAASTVRSTPVLDCLDPNTHYGDFRDDLNRDGYAVVKGVLPVQRCNEYIDQIQDWLESFNLGYNRNDPSTVKEECLPIIHQKGLIQAYGAPHESFTWGVRSEPDIIDVFATLFGTEDLLTSFDAVNVSLANRKDLPANKAWAHQDQDPERPGFRCVQGFMNLAPCGEDDGGLVILKGGHEVSKEYHDAFRQEERGFRWTNEMYLFKDTGLKWLQERGYEWVKVNCEPGDLVLWDSRTPHYNVSPKGENSRFVIYTCYAPVSTATQEELQLKKWLFENTKGHSHWPQALQPFVEEFVTPMRNGEPCPYNQWKPRSPPVLSERGYKLTGIPYIKASV